MPVVSTGDFSQIQDIAGDICSNPSNLAYAAVAANVALKAGTLIFQATANQPGPTVAITGHQCLRASEIQLDEALQILGDSVLGGALDADDYNTCLEDHNRLRDEWYDLEKRTHSYMGSWTNSIRGINHYSNTSALAYQVKHLSKKGLVQLAADKAKQGHHQSTRVNPELAERDSSKSS